MTDSFELCVERRVDVLPAAVWTAWTDHLAEWWCPKPWWTEIIENDMRPGGGASFVMHGPDGESSAMPGIYLEVTRPSRIVFTNAFTAGWVPATPFMVGDFSFADDGAGGTHYRAVARHWDEKSMHDHAAMGFADGWGAVADQLHDVARRVAGR